MKSKFKFILISFIVLFGLTTTIGLLFYPQVTVMRQVDIRASQDSILPYLTNIKNWEKWMIDTSTQVQITSPQESGIGATAIIGQSHAKISKIDSSTITIEWSGNRGNPHLSLIHIYPSRDIPNATSVQWIFTQHLNWYPWERIGAILNEKVLGPPMEDDLKRLRDLLEK